MGLPQATLTLNLVARMDANSDKLHWVYILPKKPTQEPDADAISMSIETENTDIRAALIQDLPNDDGASLTDILSFVRDGIDGLHDLRMLMETVQCSMRLPDGTKPTFPGFHGKYPNALEPGDSGVTQDGASASIVIKFGYVYKTVKGLTVYVGTHRASLHPQQAKVFHRLLGDINAEQGSAALLLPSIAPSILCNMHYTDADVLGNEDELRTELAKTAWLLYHIASKGNRIAIGLPAPTDEARQAIESETRAMLALPGGQEIPFNVSFTSADPTHHVLAITDLRLIAGVGLKSLPYPWEDDVFREREGRAADRIAYKRTARIAKREKALRDSMTPFHHRRIPQLDGWETLETLVTNLKNDDQILSVKPPRGIDSGEDYLISIEVISRDPSVLTISGGGSYSVEDGLAADLGLNGINYLNQHAQFSATLKVGDTVQRGKLMGQIEQPLGAFTHVIYSLEGRLVHDRNQILDDKQFGSVEELETGLRPNIALRYASAGLNRAPGLGIVTSTSRYGALSALDVALDYRDVNLKARGLNAGTLQGGTLSALSIKFTQSLTTALGHGQHPGFNQSGLVFSVSSERGMDILGGHFRYDQHQVKLSETIFFGRNVTRNDAFLRIQKGVGVSSGGTPVFQQFRLGGLDISPGLESGEVLANNFGFQQIEVGFGLPYLGLAPKEQGNAAFSPTNAFLKLFYASAHPTTHHTFNELLRTGAGLEGYGAGLEFRSPDQTTALTIGYAFSPSSHQHRSGTFVTGIILYF